MAVTSTKPYLLRAIYEWCTDNGFTPYIAVAVDKHTVVPREHVADGEIVLNISFVATKALKMENDFISFNARFSGVARDIIVPVDNVLAIYARENGQGMAFEATPRQDDQAMPPAVEPGLTAVSDSPTSDGDGDDKPPRKGGGGRPTLTRIK